jgi:pimeloyl-ACP methyl ester carboxylesterase
MQIGQRPASTPLEQQKWPMSPETLIVGLNPMKHFRESTGCRSAWKLVTFGLFIAALAGEIAPRIARGSDQVIEVQKTHDGVPFRYRWRLLQEKPDYCVIAVNFPSPVQTPLESNNWVPGEIFLPRFAGEGQKVPAVICLHILSGDRNLMELTCTALASRGVAGMMFRLPYYGERSPSAGPKVMLERPELFVGAITQAWQDVRRAVDLLASRPEINPQRISIMGISLGGMVAVGAAAHEPRFWRVLPILAGGNVTEIIFQARETQALREALDHLEPSVRGRLLNQIAGIDPINFAPKLREKAAAGRVWMINAAQDEVVPRACTESLAEALGLKDQVWWLEGVGHYSALSKLPEVVERTVAFFAQDVPLYQETKVVSKKDGEPPEVKLARVLMDLAKLLTMEPPEGCGYRVTVEGTIFLQSAPEKAITVEVDFARRGQGQFRLQAKLPEVGTVTLGQEVFPWILAQNGKVFVGSLATSPAKPFALNNTEPTGQMSGCSADPLRFANAQARDRVKMAAGIAAAISLAPQLLEKQQILTERLPADRGNGIRIYSPRVPGGELKIYFQADSSTPETCEVVAGGWQAKVLITRWEIDQPQDNQLFRPPDGLQREEVSCYEIHRIFAALFNYVVDRLQ